MTGDEKWWLCVIALLALSGLGIKALSVYENAHVKQCVEAK